MQLCDSIPSRNTVLSILTVFLLLMAGCSGLGPGASDTGPNGEQEGTPAETATDTGSETPTPAPTPDPTAEDLREINPYTEQLDNSTTKSGEVDRGDSQNDAGPYEPVVFAGEANTTYTITATPTNDVASSSLKLVLQAPNGTTLDVVRGESRTDTVELNTALPETGQYTLRVSTTSEELVSSFKYELDVARQPTEKEIETAKEGMFAGDPNYWNETERYGEFAYDYANFADNKDTDVEKPVTINTEDDYVVMTVIDGGQIGANQRQGMIASLGYSYSVLIDNYRENPDALKSDEWIPDAVHIRFVTPDNRGLYRIHTFTKEAAAATTADNLEPVVTEWFASISYGPANDMYDEDGAYSFENIDQYPQTNPENEVQRPPLREVSNSTSWEDHWEHRNQSES